MSLPDPVLELAAEVVPDAENHGRLAFVYAHGALLSGFGDEDEVGLMCVWDQPEVPNSVHEGAGHITKDEFDHDVLTVTTGDGWNFDCHEPLSRVAEFAYGVLLSDEDGSGTAARGVVSEFPQALAELSAKALNGDRDNIAEDLAVSRDPWLCAELLTHALYRGYVGWFAGNGYYFPGARRRVEYSRQFGLVNEVPELEQQVWQAQKPDQAAQRYVEFIDRILNDY